MVRRAFLLLWLSGCTILNSPDEARIHRVEICDNQIDDEGDELIDCGDPDCLSRFECLIDMPLERDPPCAPLLPSFTLNDGFDQPLINEERWQPLSGPGIIRDEGLELVSSGIRSRQTMTIGGSIPFQLLLVGSVVDRERSAGTSCGFSVAFDPPDTVEMPLFEVSASYVRGAEDTRFADAELVFACRYRNVPTAGRAITRRADQPFELSAIRDPETREIVAQLDGREVCRSVMDDVETPVHLRISSENSSLSECGLRVEALDLSIRTQEPSEVCAGLRRPLIPDDQCIAGPLGSVRPWEGRVVRVRDRYEMMMPEGLANRRFVRARSIDGRRDWRIELDPIFSSSWDLVETGAVLADGDLSIFWFTDSGPPVYRDQDRDGMDDDWELANGLDPTRDDSGEDINEDGISNGIEFLRGVAERGRMMTSSLDGGFTLAPQLLVFDFDPTLGLGRAPLAAAPHPRGLIGFFKGLAADGLDTIHAGFSRDGMSWKISRDPVLPRTPPNEWDGRGVRSPAVVFTGDFYLMAYAATEWSQKSAIGLALSKDGTSWTRHANNPVVTRDDVGFDDEGVEPRSIELDGDVIRIWYFARTNAPNPCLRPRNDYKQIGLTELRGRPRP